MALIEEDLGPRISLDVAREMVMYLKRPGGQSQYSDYRERFAGVRPTAAPTT